MERIRMLFRCAWAASTAVADRPVPAAVSRRTRAQSDGPGCPATVRRTSPHNSDRTPPTPSCTRLPGSRSPRPSRHRTASTRSSSQRSWSWCPVLVECCLDAVKYRLGCSCPPEPEFLVLAVLRREPFTAGEVAQGVRQHEVVIAGHEVEGNGPDIGSGPGLLDRGGVLGFVQAQLAARGLPELVLVVWPSPVGGVGLGLGDAERAGDLTPGRSGLDGLVDVRRVAVVLGEVLADRRGGVSCVAVLLRTTVVADRDWRSGGAPPGSGPPAVAGRSRAPG